MRRIILAATLMPLACAAFAQTNTGKMGAPTGPAPSMSSPAMSGAGGTDWTVRPPDPNNCGTPDAPMPCSGHAVKTYRSNRKHGST